MPKHPLINAPTPINASVPFVQTMHGDTSSSDSSILSGPELGAETFNAVFFEQKATFPTLLRRSDGHIMALATSFAVAQNEEESDKAILAKVYLIDGDSGLVMGTPQTVPQVSMMAGVYAYLNQRDILGGEKTDQLIVTSATRPDPQKTPVTTIMSYSASLDTNHRLALDAGVTLADISDHLYPSQLMPTMPTNGVEPSLQDDAVVSLSPDEDGDIWFASAQGKIGICQLLDHDTASTQSIALDVGETINNSFSTAIHSDLGNVAAITTNSQLHLVKKDQKTGAPVLVWSQGYNYGDTLKPGQLQYPPSFFATPETDHQFGTGSTPTFFGPDTGCEWVAITDNAPNALNLHIFSVTTGALVAEASLFTEGNPAFRNAPTGTENSVMAYGNTVIIPSTFGYPYPVPPFFVRKESPFIGGLTRFDILPNDDGGHTAHHQWTEYHRSAAVPKFAVNDDKIYTIIRRSPHQNEFMPIDRAATLRDTFSVASICSKTGAIDTLQPLVMNLPTTHTTEELSALGNPLQMACCFSVDSNDKPVMWQGTFSGYYRISS